jgi:hypothetical protein
LEPDRAQSVHNLNRWSMVGVIVAIAVAATFLRQTGVPKSDTMWAEDGTVFSQCAYDQPPVSCLFVPYQGYLHTVPRLAALTVPLGDPGSLPLRLVLLAAMLAAASAAMAGAAIAEVTGSSAAGLIAGTGLVLIYPAGSEVSGNLANIHWILLTASVLVIACSWLGRRPRFWDLGLLALTALTSALGPMLVPLAALSLLRREPWARTMTVLLLVAALPQLVVEFTAARATIARPPVDRSALLTYMWNLVFRTGWFGPGHLTWNYGVPTLTAALVVALALVRSRTAGEGRPYGLTLQMVPVAATLALPALGLFVFSASVLLNRVHPNRYAYVPAAMFIAAIALAAGLLASRITYRLRDRWPRKKRMPVPPAGSLLASGIVLVLGMGFAMTFRMDAIASSGPDATAEIEALRDRCTAGAPAIKVTISPRVPARLAWQVTIPCREFGTAERPATPEGQLSDVR